MLLLPAQALHYLMPIIGRRATAAELPHPVVSLKTKAHSLPVIAAGARPRAVQGLERWVIYTAASALTSVKKRQLCRGDKPRMKFKVNDVSLHVIVEGDEQAPPVLLLHGFPDSSKLWSGQVSYTGHSLQFHLRSNASIIQPQYDLMHLSLICKLGCL